MVSGFKRQPFGRFADNLELSNDSVLPVRSPEEFFATHLDVLFYLLDRVEDVSEI